MPDTFCALPFKHLCVGFEGTARICCVTNDLVSEHGAPMSLNNHTMDEIWNSAYMRNIRRKMLQGERISACTVCYQSEAATGQSYRTMVGSQPIQGQRTTRAEISHCGSQSGFRVGEQPTFIKLEIGNLCNLKCRMCYGGNSSQIERDPVHGVWSGGVEPLHAVWRGDLARIGPEPRIGVRTAGLYPHRMIDGTVNRWTDGHAIFNVSMQSGTALASLELLFHRSGVRGQDYQIVVNSRPMAKGILRSGDSQVAIDLRDFSNLQNLTIEIVSSKFVDAAGNPECGLPLSAVTLRRKSSEFTDRAMGPQLLSRQEEVARPWYMDDHRLFHDVLAAGNALRRLYITGGEPLINARVTDVLDFLIERDVAQKIHLQLATNCTHVDAQIVERFYKFGEVDILLSLDGVDETYEYIRYPARWSAVDKNVRKLKNQFGLRCYAAPVVQAYNILRLTDLYRYCDSLGIEVLENIMTEPARLAINNLPSSVRKAAADKIMKYHMTDPNGTNKPSRLALAHYLDALDKPVEGTIIHELMIFTNDLDATRAQSVRQVHPDLVELLAAAGFDWIDDLRYAKSTQRNKPARERDYAWL